MFVGIDVHKHVHAAALIDERGGEQGTLLFANSPDGYRRLLGWLADRGATTALIGVGALAAAGQEVLHVPAWRTHRERRRQGPGKTDPGDALAIADVAPAAATGKPSLPRRASSRSCSGVCSPAARTTPTSSRR